MANCSLPLSTSFTKCRGRGKPLTDANEIKPIKKRSEQSLSQAMLSVARLLSPCGKRVTHQHQGRPSLACDPGRERRKKLKNTGDITLNRHKTFRNILRKEGTIYKPELLIYKVEYPPRVTVRLEYLMRSSKVKLNDREYMEKLYEGLIEEEAKYTDKVHEQRRESEKERVKTLVVEGYMDPPPGMEYLNRHPVFRVNRMMSRLEKYNQGLQAPEKPTESITPVEPYEFDGNTFFMELHKGNPYWIPEEEMKLQQEKLDGKIARARQRLREQKIKDDYYHNARSSFFRKTLEVATVTEESANPDEELKQVRRTLRNQERNQALKDQDFEKALENEKRRRQYLERIERKRKARQRRHDGARAMFFLAELEEERQRYIQKHKDRTTKEDESTFFKKRIQQPKLDEYFYPSLIRRVTQTNPEDKEKNEKRSSSIKKKPKKYEHIFRRESVQEKEEENPDSFTELRRKFGLQNSHMYEQLKPRSNHMIKEYFHGDEDSAHMYEVADGITLMHRREQLKANDFIRNLHQNF